jgi:hypothetical protein
VARRLADLTLRLTRELSALEARCAKERDEAEKSRDRALMKFDSAQGILKRYQQGLAKAKDAQLKSIQKANDIRDKEIRSAEDHRTPALAARERKYRQAKVKAMRKREEAIRKAKAKRKAALAKARGRPLPEQRAILKAADRAFEEAEQEARERYQSSIEGARLALQSAVRDVLDDERQAVEAATQKADRMISNAAVVYERAVARVEASMRGELAKVPEARKIQEKYDRRLSQILASCDRKKEALFRKFTADRKRLKR